MSSPQGLKPIYRDSERVTNLEKSTPTLPASAYRSTRAPGDNPANVTARATCV